MAKQCTMRDVSCTCRFAPLCPGFGGRGRAFSSSEKKPPAGLKDGKLEEVEEGAGVVDEPEAMGRERREARRPGRRKVLDCGRRHRTQT